MIKRLRTAIDEKYGSYEAASVAMGMNRGNLSTLINKRDPRSLRIESINRIANAFPEYNVEWILERSDFKLKKDIIHPSPTGRGALRNEEIIAEPKNTPTITNGERGRPYYDVDFIGGFEQLENNQTLIPIHYIDFAPFNDADFWINVTGKSMGPLIAHGDIVALKEVHDWQSFLLEGEMYAIVTFNGFRTIKILGRDPDNKDGYLLIPYNKNGDYYPQPIAKEKITRIFRVKGAIKKFF